MPFKPWKERERERRRERERERDRERVKRFQDSIWNEQVIGHKFIKVLLDNDHFPTLSMSPLGIKLDTARK